MKFWKSNHADSSLVSPLVRPRLAIVRRFLPKHQSPESQDNPSMDIFQQSIIPQYADSNDPITSYRTQLESISTTISQLAEIHSQLQTEYNQLLVQKKNALNDLNQASQTLSSLTTFPPLPDCPMCLPTSTTPPSTTPTWPDPHTDPDIVTLRANLEAAQAAEADATMRLAATRAAHSALHTSTTTPPQHDTLDSEITMLEQQIRELTVAADDAAARVQALREALNAATATAAATASRRQARLRAALDRVSALMFAAQIHGDPAPCSHCPAPPQSGPTPDLNPLDPPDPEAPTDADVAAARARLQALRTHVSGLLNEIRDLEANLSARGRPPPSTESLSTLLSEAARLDEAHTVATQRALALEQAIMSKCAQVEGASAEAVGIEAAVCRAEARVAVLRNALAAAQCGDHDTARRLVASLGPPMSPPHTQAAPHDCDDVSTTHSNDVASRPSTPDAFGDAVAEAERARREAVRRALMVFRAVHGGGEDGGGPCGGGGYVGGAGSVDGGGVMRGGGVCGEGYLGRGNVVVGNGRSGGEGGVVRNVASVCI